MYLFGIYVYLFFSLHNSGHPAIHHIAIAFVGFGATRRYLGLT